MSDPTTPSASREASSRSPLPVPPPVVALAALLAQRALTVGAPPPGPLRRSLAAALALSSIGLAATAARGFRRTGTTVDPHHPDRASALVTDGVFGLTRNPMYVGLTGLVTAHAVRRGTLRALLPAAGLVAALDRIQIPAEEAALAARFGPAYDDYRADVPRWLGPV